MQLKMVDSASRRLRQRYQRFLNKRLPPVKSIQLNQKSIFIFPSRVGLYFLALLLLLLLAAINYQNNMIFALTFLLVSIFIITILHTYGNLSGLTITAIKAIPTFAGSQVEYQIRFSRKSAKPYFDVLIHFEGGESKSISLVDTDEDLVSIPLVANHRGLHFPGRLRLETIYPLGLIKAWSLVALDIEAVVYPKPLESALINQLCSDSNSDDGESTAISGSDDFYEFKTYQAGDPLKHIHWKAFAKGYDLQTKQFASYRDKRLWLDFQTMTGSTEERLQKLCYWALHYHRIDVDYGLRLPETSIKPDHGQVHLQSVLKSLALYDLGRQRP